MSFFVQGVWKRLGGYFLAGLLAILPLVITVAIITWVANFLLGLIGPGTFIGRMLGNVGTQLIGDEILAYLLGCVLVVAVIFLLGVCVETGLKRFFMALIEPWIHRIPLAGNIYRTAAQVVSLLEKKDDAAVKGMRVVYCSFGAAQGCGLVALMPTSDKYLLQGREYCMIYIPTSPLPMTGGLILVPADSVQLLDVSVDGLMSIYLSMGVTTPQFLQVGSGPA